MAERKTPNKGYQKLKSDLSAGNIGQVYIFYGEESYLREYYLGEIKKKLVPTGFEEFNYHRLSGKTLTMQELKKIDEVAYVRFASVYQQFADVESFFNELKKLMGDRKK